MLGRGPPAIIVVVAIALVSTAIFGPVTGAGSPQPGSSEPGEWILTTFYPPFNAEGVYVFDVAAATWNRSRPAVVFHDYNDDNTHRIMFSADPLDGAPFEEVMRLPSNPINPNLFIALGPQGVPHIWAYYEILSPILPPTSFVYYSTKSTEGNWVTEELAVDLLPLRFKPEAVEVTPDGTPHVLGIRGTWEILSRLDGAWHAEPVGLSTSFPDFSSGENDHLHVCYVDHRGVIHRWGHPGSLWNEEIVLVRPFHSRRCSITMGVGDLIHLAFDGTPVSNSSGQRALIHAMKTGPIWEFDVIPSPAFGSAIPYHSLATNETGAVWASVFIPSEGSSVAGQYGASWEMESFPSLTEVRRDSHLTPGIVRPFLTVQWGELRMWHWEDVPA
ncbi:MAG: hypothetical protein HY556_02600 [Euryarchaeota archaeon]|nr:hypothetical protein [Euryarchaeota archaeon]